MKYLITLLSFVPLTLLSQKIDSTGNQKIAIGFTFSPDYCYRILKADASVESIAKNRDSLEVPKLGFTTGFNVAFKLNKRFTLETGLLFSDKGEKTKPNEATWIPPTSQPDPLLPVTVSYNYHYIYFDLPLNMKFNILMAKRMNLFLTAGVSANVFLTQKISHVYGYTDGHTSSGSASSGAGFTRINLALIAGFGFTYELTEKLTLKVEPLYRRSVNSIIDAPIKGYLYSLGLNTGIYFKL